MNPENGATARDRACRAAVINVCAPFAGRLTDLCGRRFSEAVNDALQQAHEIGGDAPRGLHDLRVIERLR